MYEAQSGRSRPIPSVVKLYLLSDTCYQTHEFAVVQDTLRFIFAEKVQYTYQECPKVPLVNISVCMPASLPI